MSHAVQGPLRRTGHSEEFWQNVVHQRKKWQTASVFLLQETQEQYGQGGLACCSPQGCKESDTTDLKWNWEVESVWGKFHQIRPNFQQRCWKTRLEETLPLWACYKERWYWWLKKRMRFACFSGCDCQPLGSLIIRKALPICVVLGLVLPLTLSLSCGSQGPFWGQLWPLQTESAWIMMLPLLPDLGWRPCS